MCWSWTVCSWSPATAWGFNSSAFLKRDPGCLATTTCLRRPQDQVKFRMVVCLAVGIHNSNVRVLAMPLQLEPWAHVPPQHEDSAGVSTLETRVYKERGGSKLCVSTHTDRLTCVGICMKGRTLVVSGDSQENETMIGALLSREVDALPFNTGLNQTMDAFRWQSGCSRRQDYRCSFRT